MANSNPTTRFRFWLWLIRAVGVIVPRRLRANWRQEWEAELRHREEMLAEWDRLDWRSKLDLLRRSTSAFWDALWLQPKRLEDEMFQDLRFGVRMLRTHPGFTLIAAFTLALGIGASTAIFSAVNPILFEPLPYPQPSRLMMIWEMQSDGSPSQKGTAFGIYRGLVERSRAFDALAVMKAWQPTMTGASWPEQLDGQRVSASYFRVLGVAPALGRDFLASDDQPRGPNVAIISDGLWRRRFGGDPAIIGRQIALDDDSSHLTSIGSYTVIGVMPSGFEDVLATTAEVWSPLQYNAALPANSKEWGHHLRLVGRLLPGASADQARSESDQIARELKQEYPNDVFNERFIINPLQGDVTRSVKPALLAVLGAVILVLLIACVNVTNLLLARAAQRRGEFAMRAALGAGRVRLIRQLLTESLLLAALGGALGMVVAQFGIRALVALSPPGLPRVTAIELDVNVFAFGVGLTTLVGLFFGLIPALHASRADLRAGIQKSSWRTTGGHRLTRETLVVAEVALAIVLLVSAGLLWRSIERLFGVGAGFDASHLLTMQVTEVGPRFLKDSVRYRFFADALEAVRRVPGVTAAAFTTQLPLSGEETEYGVSFESEVKRGADEDHDVFRYAVTPGYFETMGMPLLRGRLLDAHDTAGAPLAVVISASLAKFKFSGQDPIGQRLCISRTDGPWFTIVGVVDDVKQTSLAANQSEAVYTTTSQWYWVDTAQSLVVRARGNPAALAPAIRQAIWSVDKDQPIVRVATMDELLAQSEAQRRFALILFEVFGLVALALAAIGIYGVLSGSVTERTREIGVRLALGAQRRDVLALILRQGVALTLSGVGLGLLTAWAVTRWLSKLLYNVSATDPWTFGGVALLLTVVALVACYVPARRATRVDPLVTLRHE
jgi:putative ABC transport system permease protein